MKKLTLFFLLISQYGWAFQAQAPFNEVHTGEGYALHYQFGDKFFNQVDLYTQRAIKTIPGFLMRAFKKKVDVYLFPTREALDQQWRSAWGIPDFKSQCWMVGSGLLHRLDLLSPSVWSKQACEHDPTDDTEIELLILHELTHVLHSDHNRSPAFDQINNLDWFVEGLATYVSGQLDTERLEGVKKYVKEKTGPSRLKDFWTGQHRYGQAGSMVAFIDQRFGRQVLSDPMVYNDVEDILAKLNLTEQELIRQWKEYLLK